MTTITHTFLRIQGRTDCNYLGVPIMGFISRADILKFFNISVWTLRRWQKERQFPDAICASGKVRMYRKFEVEDWLEAQATHSKLVNL